MSPSTNRWRPRRAGIINLYEYADQIFDFAGGRLLLRGHNTSGKTKALELLLPFCLDGDIRPRSSTRSPRAPRTCSWNLVGCIDQEQRDGYVWLEFERIDETGVTRRLTAGIGMHASKQLPKVTRWYFVARERRVGADLRPDARRQSDRQGRARGAHSATTARCSTARATTARVWATCCLASMARSSTRRCSG